MTPMLDIVFILLIFFIVTATFLNEEGVDLRPPPPCEGDGCDRPNESILVQVNDQDRVFVNQDITDRERVLAAINRLRVEAPDASVVLEVDDEASHGVIVYIWDDLRANDIPVQIVRSEE